LCYEYSSDAFWDAMKRARQIFRDQPLWTKLMKRAMARNFSWDGAAQRYEALYAELVGAPDKELLRSAKGAIQREPAAAPQES
jgi:glycogen synthase